MTNKDIVLSTKKKCGLIAMMFATIFISAIEPFSGYEPRIAFPIQGSTERISFVFRTLDISWKVR